MARSSMKVILVHGFDDGYRIDYMGPTIRRDVEGLRHALSDYWCGNTISNGMMSGTICDGDADCSDATGADSAPAAAADDDDGGDPDPEPARRQPSNTHPQAIAPSPARASERGTATATAGKPSPRIDPESELWRLPAVLAHVPISRSSWFAGVRSGRYPKPVRLSERRVAWRASDIRSFVAAL